MEWTGLRPHQSFWTWPTPTSKEICILNACWANIHYVHWPENTSGQDRVIIFSSCILKNDCLRFSLTFSSRSWRTYVHAGLIVSMVLFNIPHHNECTQHPRTVRTFIYYLLSSIMAKYPAEFIPGNIILCDTNFKMWITLLYLAPAFDNKALNILVNIPLYLLVSQCTCYKMYGFTNS